MSTEKGRWRSGALAALAAASLLLSSCAAPPPEPTPTAGPPTATAGPPTPTAVPPATLPPPPADLGPAKGVLLAPTPSALPVGVAELDGQVARALSGQDRADLASLLRTAQRTGAEAERYRAYLGAWQYMRDLYVQNGERPEHKALLDALEAVGKSFPQYQPGDFALDPAASR
jgi:hypothetical protein